MKLSIVESGLFKLDGGAMFGVVPKTLWNKLNPADENNKCTWSMRLLLVEINDRKILIDTGMGDKQDERFRSFFHPHGPYSLDGSLQSLHVNPDEITDVFLTHLHFDHDGGAVSRVNGELLPTFKNATYWSNENHYNWAYKPNDREKASFLKENFVPLSDHGVLKFIDEKQDIDWLPEISIRFSYGHTEAMMSPIIKLPNGKRLIYCADLMPSSFHIPMAYIMCYDIRPLETLKEKDRLLEEAAELGDILFFEHDPINQCGTVKRNDRGRIVIDKVFPLSELNIHA